MPTLRMVCLCVQREKPIFHSRTLQEEIKPCFTQLDPIFSSYLCLQYLFTMTSFKECKCYPFFPFEKVPTTRFTASRIIHCIWISEGGELRGTHEHERNFSPFFWEHQSLRFFDVRSKTIAKNLMWYLSTHPSCCPICCLVLAGAGLALVPLFFLQPTDISSIFPSGSKERHFLVFSWFQQAPTLQIERRSLYWKVLEGKKMMWSDCFYCVINIKIKQEEVKQSAASGLAAWETITSHQKKGIPWKQQL